MKNKDKLITVIDKIAKAESKSPEEVIAELNNMTEKEILNKLNNMGIFKEDSKLDYLVSLKNGGCVKKNQKGNVLSNGSVKKQVKKNDKTITSGKTERGADFTIHSGPNGAEKVTIGSNVGSAGYDQSTYKLNPSILGQIFIPGYYRMSPEMKYSADSLVNLSVPMHQEGSKLRRRDARKNAEENRGMSRSQFRQAYRNAKNSLRESGPEDLRGKELRQAARHAFDQWDSVDNQPVISAPTQTLNPIIPDYKKRQDDSITRNPVRFKPTELRISDNLTYRDPEIEMPELVVDVPKVGKSIRSEADAWNQYQYERALFDKQGVNGAGNYRPDQRSAEYMHYMRDDFMNNAYDPTTGTIRSDYVMKTPSAEELNRFKNAGRFKYDVLPLGLDYSDETRAYEAGIKPEERFFWNQKTAQPGAIPTTGLHDAAGMGAAALMLGVHTLPELLTSPVTTDAINYVVKPTLDELRFVNPRLTDAARGAVETGGRIITNAGNSARNAANGVKEFGNSLVYATENIAPGAKSAIVNSANRVANAARTTGNAVKTAGKNFVERVVPQTTPPTSPGNYANWGGEFVAPFRNGGLLENSRNILKNRK